MRLGRTREGGGRGGWRWSLHMGTKPRPGRRPIFDLKRHHDGAVGGGHSRGAIDGDMGTKPRRPSPPLPRSAIMLLNLFSFFSPLKGCRKPMELVWTAVTVAVAAPRTWMKLVVYEREKSWVGTEEVTTVRSLRCRYGKMNI